MESRNTDHVKTCPFLPDGGQHLKLNRTFNCSYSDIEKELSSLDTDLDEKPEQTEKKNQNELIVDLPDNMVTKNLDASKTSEKEQTKKNLKEPMQKQSIEMVLDENSNQIKPRLVNLSTQNSMNRTNLELNSIKIYNDFNEDCYSDDSDCEFDVYTDNETDSDDNDEADGRCSKCSLENKINILNTNSLLNYLDTSNNNQKYKENDFKFKNTNNSSPKKFNSHLNKFTNSHPATYVIPLKTKI